MIPAQVLSIVERYKSKDYFPHGRIPPAKLENAKNTYFLDSDDEPIALIDATILGSAKKGMVIGVSGLYWRNEDGDDTDPHFISWDNLLVGRKSVTTTFFSGVVLGTEGKFDLTSCAMSKALLAKLLMELVELHRVSPIGDESIDVTSFGPVARELYEARSQLRAANLQALDVENRIALIDAKKPPSYWMDGWRGVLVELFAWPIAILVFILLGSLHWIVGLVSGLLALGFYSNLVGAKARKRLQAGLSSLIDHKVRLEGQVARLVQAVLPEVHSLGMATLEDVLAKTPAAGLGAKETRRLLELDVKNGNLEKITLFDGKILYKSRSLQAGMNETTEMSID